jgi:hypothetical protein
VGSARDGRGTRTSRAAWRTMRTWPTRPKKTSAGATACHQLDQADRSLSVYRLRIHPSCRACSRRVTCRPCNGYDGSGRATPTPHAVLAVFRDGDILSPSYQSPVHGPEARSRGAEGGPSLPLMGSRIVDLDPLERQESPKDPPVRQRTVLTAT